MSFGTIDGITPEPERVRHKTARAWLKCLPGIAYDAAGVR
jgi:hypothetical protein